MTAFENCSSALGEGCFGLSGSSAAEGLLLGTTRRVQAGHGLGEMIAIHTSRFNWPERGGTYKGLPPQPQTGAVCCLRLSCRESGMSRPSSDPECQGVSCLLRATGG